jgi:hypothetical protein
LVDRGHHLSQHHLHHLALSSHPPQRTKAESQERERCFPSLRQCQRERGPLVRVHPDDQLESPDRPAPLLRRDREPAGQARAGSPADVRVRRRRDKIHENLSSGQQQTRNETKRKQNIIYFDVISTIFAFPFLVDFSRKYFRKI